ncbi:MAG: hypothetical protein ACREX4_19175 [Gammaproteobacteria bacterium]
MSNHNTLEALLARLEAVRSTGDGQYVARCPAHADGTPSLAIRDVDGVILVHCFGGCAVHDIVHAVDMELSDLFPARAADYGAIDRSVKFNARQILMCIAGEALMIRLYAQDAIDGTLTEADVARLKTAEDRIAEAMRYVR